MRHSFVALAVMAMSSAALAQSENSNEPMHHRQPPPESIAACASLNDGTACGFTVDGKNLTGTCRTLPKKEVKACVPEGFGKHHGHHGPPPQALEACKSLAAGATCSVKFEERTMTGSCADHDGQLACRPSDMPEGGHGGFGKHHGPPPEALDACKSLAVGATCSVTFKEKTISGTCRQGPNGEAAACMPERRDQP